MSTLWILAASARRTGHSAAGTNATSHWVFGEAAYAEDRPSWKYTGTGYAIHHVTSLFWAMLFARYRRKGRGIGTALVDAGLTAAVAAFADYVLTPKRLTPGFEERLALEDMAGTYGAYAVGLALGTAAQDRHARSPREAVGARDTGRGAGAASVRARKRSGARRRRPAPPSPP